MGICAGHMQADGRAATFRQGHGPCCLCPAWCCLRSGHFFSRCEGPIANERGEVEAIQLFNDVDPTSPRFDESTILNPLHKPRMADRSGVETTRQILPAVACSQPHTMPSKQARFAFGGLSPWIAMKGSAMRFHCSSVRTYGGSVLGLVFQNASPSQADSVTWARLLSKSGELRTSCQADSVQFFQTFRTASIQSYRRESSNRRQ